MRIPFLTDVSKESSLEKITAKVLSIFGNDVRPVGIIQDQLKAVERYQKTEWMWYSEYSDIMRIVHLTLQTHLFRNGLEIKAKFASKCTNPNCGYELKDESAPACPKCQELMREPDPIQKKKLQAWFKKVNSNGQTIHDFCVQLERDFETYDDVYILYDCDYLFDKTSKNLIGAELKEIVRIDPIWMLLKQDRRFRYGVNAAGENVFVCLQHRDREQLTERCGECGKQAFPIFYTYDGYGDKKIHYASFEIQHVQKYTPSLHYGTPPIKAALLKIKTLMGQDYFLFQTYSVMRPPAGVLVFSSTNPEGVDLAIQRAREERKKNPLEPLMLALQSEGSTNTVNFVDMIRSNQEMQFVEMRTEFRRIVLATYGVAPMFAGDIASSGGLSNESRQLQVLDDTVEFGQTVLNDKVLAPIIERLQCPDYEIIVRPAIEKDKLETITLKKANAEYAQLMRNLGYTNEIEPDNEDGEFTYKKDLTPQPTFQPSPFQEQKEEVQKEVKKKQELEAELAALLTEAKKKLKVRGTPSREQAEQLAQEVKSFFDRKHLPIVQRELERIIKTEWSNLEHQYGVRLLLGTAGDSFIEQAVSNLFLDRAVQNFNIELLTRLTDRVADKDITLSNLVKELRQTMDDRESKLLTIARTESSKAANGARALAYAKIKQPDDRYSWDIIQDTRTTGTCKRIHDRTKNGVEFKELIHIIQEESAKEFPDWTVDPYQPCAHYSCRSLLKLVRS